MQYTKPKRHGCLTAFLIVMIIANTLTALLYLFGSESIEAAWPSASPATFIALGLTGICNIIFAIALFQWKKWGFYGFAATALVVFGINLTIGVGIVQALLGLAGVGILYWTLQMGDERKAWPYLE